MFLRKHHAENAMPCTRESIQIPEAVAPYGGKWGFLHEPTSLENRITKLLLDLISKLLYDVELLQKVPPVEHIGRKPVNQIVHADGCPVPLGHDTPLGTNVGESTLPLIGAQARCFGTGERVPEARARPLATCRPTGGSPYGANPNLDLDSRRKPFISKGRLCALHPHPLIRRRSP